jgi:hypothetical protein
MLGAGPEFVVEQEAFGAEVAHDGGEAVTALVGAPDVFATTAGVVHRGDVDGVGKIFESVDFERGGGVGFEEGEVGSLKLLHRGPGGEGFEAGAQGGFGGSFSKVKGFGEARPVVLPEEFDVAVMSAALHEEADLGGQDIAVGDTVRAGPFGLLEEVAEAAEIGEELARERESAMGVDFLVGK